MKTAVIGSEKSATEVKDVKGAATDKNNIRPNVPLKEEGKKEEGKDKPEPTSQSAAPKEADKGGDLPFDFKAPALNLDSTIKIALELNRKINQRGKLLETIDTLETFELWQEMQRMKGKSPLELNWRRLGISDQRIYEAFETAILDLVGQLLGAPICQLLGGSYRDKVDCMGWTGRRTNEEAADKAFEAMQKGHKVFKFKCADDDDVSLWLDAIKSKCGYGIKILLDPNQRWTDVATTLKKMKDVDPVLMLGLEDPISHGDDHGLASLKEQLGIPIFRHISLPYHQDIGDMVSLVRTDAADGYNFNGRAFDSVLLAEISHLEGKSCWRGSEVDLGISEVMGLHIAAASVNCVIPSDIFGELVRTDDLIEEGIVFEDGAAIVPMGSGLGVSLDYKAMEQFAKSELFI